MSGQVTTETSVAPRWHLRPAALCAAGVARILARLSPEHLRWVLELARCGARSAGEIEALRARNAVVAVSMRCTGRWCLQRSIATALLCRMHGCWPEWRTGVRTQPFQAHAWVAVDGKAVGESDDIQFFHPTMTVPSRR
ncbi:MAG: lasso peptide biosynthesis B2 protein [Actinomycetota bacterium]|nr:lasso peptide biosynthesis B2 protein [Actinomycetota bacterium]